MSTRSGKKDPPSVLEKLHSWMYTLLYPAVLGSMIVTCLLALFGEGRDPESAAAPTGMAAAYLVFLLLYFSSQHVENTLDPEGYGKSMFLSDLAEIALMFFLFRHLGAIGSGQKAAITQEGSACFYILLATAFACPVLARMVSTGSLGTELRGILLSLLSLVAVVLSLTGVFLPGSMLLFVLLCLVLAGYFVFFVFLNYRWESKADDPQGSA